MKKIIIVILAIIIMVAVYIGIRYMNTDCVSLIQAGAELPQIDVFICNMQLK